MSEELKKIKELYGENMAHLCRELFSTILENEGLLLKTLTSRFNPSKFLYDDIMSQSQKEGFRELIFSLADIGNIEVVTTDKTPSELLSEAGYTLYECKTEEDIQSFKKYYKSGEELCTFNGGRLESDFVFFAVKKDVDSIRRRDFIRPTRQDLYGTSVISIQFQRGENNVLSIKNRYNHHVDNPDATFGNNLENIIRGLTYSFENHYKLSVVYNKANFELNNYVLASDGKYYKYNSEIDHVYYCANNIIIRRTEIIRLDPSRYLLIDYFIIDLQEKTIIMEKNGDNFVDSFLDSIKELDKLSVINTDYGKEITITFKDKEKKNTIIRVNKSNNIIEVHDCNVEYGDKEYLKLCDGLIELDVPNMKATGKEFLANSVDLEFLNMPSAEKIGDDNLYSNKMLRRIILQSAISIGNNFLHENEIVGEIIMPFVETIGNDFIPMANGITEVYFKCLRKVKNNFLYKNKSAKIVIMPAVEEVEDFFMPENTLVEKVYMPSLVKAGGFYFNYNIMLKEIELLSLEEMGSSCFFHNSVLERANFPSLKMMGPSCFGLNDNVRNQLLQQIEQNSITK